LLADKGVIANGKPETFKDLSLSSHRVPDRNAKYDNDTKQDVRERVRGIGGCVIAIMNQHSDQEDDLNDGNHHADGPLPHFIEIIRFDDKVLHGEGFSLVKCKI
jgi:hypothetical protein